MITYPELLPRVQESLAETTGRATEEFTSERKIGEICSESLEFVEVLLNLEEEFDLPSDTIEQTPTFQGHKDNLRNITVGGIANAIAEILYEPLPQKGEAEKQRSRWLLRY